jgi:hypothetical protein
LTSPPESKLLNKVGLAPIRLGIPAVEALAMAAPRCVLDEPNEPLHLSLTRLFPQGQNARSSGEPKDGLVVVTNAVKFV